MRCPDCGKTLRWRSRSDHGGGRWVCAEGHRWRLVNGEVRRQRD